MVLANHEFQCLLGMFVVEIERFGCGYVYTVGKSLFKLYESDNAIVDDGNELGPYAFTNQRHLADFE